MLIIKGGYAPVMLYMQGVGIILFSRSAILYRLRQLSNELNRSMLTGSIFKTACPEGHGVTFIVGRAESNVRQLC